MVLYTVHRYCLHIAAVIVLYAITAALSSPSNCGDRTQLCLYRENESQPLVTNQTYSIRCTVNNCSQREHHIIFIHLSHHGYHLLESHTSAFPNESQLSVSRQKYRNHDSKCHRTMTFIATEALNGTTIQCKAIDYSTWTYSRATWIQLQRSSSTPSAPDELVDIAIESTDTPTQADLTHVTSSSAFHLSDILTLLLLMSSAHLLYMFYF